MDQGSTRKRSAVHNFAPTVTKFCVMWEGQALPHDTKFGNCRCKIVGRRVIFIWPLIHGSSWSRLIKAEPGIYSCFSTIRINSEVWTKPKVNITTPNGRCDKNNCQPTTDVHNMGKDTVKCNLLKWDQGYNFPKSLTIWGFAKCKPCFCLASNWRVIICKEFFYIKLIAWVSQGPQAKCTVQCCLELGPFSIYWPSFKVYRFPV